MKQLLRTFYFSALSSLSFAAFASQPFNIPKVTESISVDGEMNEAVWQNAVKVDMNIVTRPYDNTKSPIQTEAWLMTDDNKLYVGFIAKDPDPSQIRAFYRDRDKAWGDDIVGLKIDSFNDQRTAYRFLSNPLGAQIDGIENEVTKKESDAWDGIWDSKGKILEDGYVVEMALPFRMLNFVEQDGKQTWGIELVRFYPREQRLRLSNIRLERGNSCELCQLAEATGFEGAEQGNNLTITPALVLGKSETLEDDGWQEDESTEASLDVRWGITPDILLNATLNPDFSTVETDQAQLSVNNTFALFFDEKRPFFLDNAEYFDSFYNLVYTRNINAPNYGGKLTARQGDHQLGIFLTDDDSTNILVPGNRGSSIAEIDDESQAAVIRYRNNTSDKLTLGWISTLRQAEDYENAVHGIDGRYKLTDEDVFRLQTLHSETEYPDDLYEQFCDADNPEDCLPDNVSDCDLSQGCDTNEQVLRTNKNGKFSGNAVKFEYRHNSRYWDFNSRYEKQNAGFRGDLGFISRVDYNKFVFGGKRKWYGEQSDWWQQIDIYSDWDITHNDDGELLEKEFDISSTIYGPYESQLFLKYTNRDAVGVRIDKSNLDIDGNTTLFTENEYHVFAEVKPIAGLYLNTKLEFGDAIDFANNRLADRQLVRGTANYNINRHLEVKLRHTFVDLSADNAAIASNNVFRARLTDLRTTYQFNIQSFVRVSLIYSNISRNPDNYLYVDPDDIDRHSRDLSAEILYGYKINPQTVFYAGYSEHQDSTTTFSDLEKDDKSLFMKVSYAWQH